VASETSVLFSNYLDPSRCPATRKQMLEAPRPLPGNVTLSLDEYNRLLALANRPGKKTDTPPVPYVLKHADLKFRVVNDDVIGSIQFDGGKPSKRTLLKSRSPRAMTIFDARHGAKPLPAASRKWHAHGHPSGRFRIRRTASMSGIPLSIETVRASFYVASSIGWKCAHYIDRSRRGVPNGPAQPRHHQLIAPPSPAIPKIEATLVPWPKPPIVWWNTRESGRARRAALKSAFFPTSNR